MSNQVPSQYGLDPAAAVYLWAVSCENEEEEKKNEEKRKES